MTFSISGAELGANQIIALREISIMQSDLTVTSNRISSGSRVASATDDGSSYAIARNMEGRVAALELVENASNCAGEMPRKKNW